MYFWAAHQYLETHDEPQVFKKMKSVRIPFQGSVDQGEKVEAFSHQPYDQRQRIVPSPRMGAPVARRYEEIIGDYRGKQERKQQRADQEIAMKAHLASVKVQENRKAYEEINSKSKFGIL